jgi:hypothetical protein
MKNKMTDKEYNQMIKLLAKFGKDAARVLFIKSKKISEDQYYDYQIDYIANSTADIADRAFLTEYEKLGGKIKGII